MSRHAITSMRKDLAKIEDVVFIGDLHGDMGDWTRFRNEHKMTVQLGDLGCGFVQLPVPQMNHWFIRGNHDSPDIASQRPDYIGDYETIGRTFFVSGAASVDADRRHAGMSWWADEQLSEYKMRAATSMYSDARPEVVVSHCAPACIELRLNAAWRRSRTTLWFDSLLELHQPMLWVFGHYHVAFDCRYNGTRFTCVPQHGVWSLK